jgi:PhzF family phenazine biosynthesis protein
MSGHILLKYAAFSSDPSGGNPAGVWIGDELPDADDMQRIAAEVGFSETAFIAPATGRNRLVRYFSPAAEVPFCGHATIASGVALATLEGDGVYRLDTRAGRVPVSVESRNGTRVASLTSVDPKHIPAPDSLVAEALVALNWTADDLDKSILPAVAFAGAWHLILAAATRDRLSALHYDFERLRAAMLDSDLTTLQLVWRQEETLFQSRNPFPVGGVVEDPATGAAAAALGGYLRNAKLIETPRVIRILQGEDMGRPGLITVEIPREGGIVVSGTAVRI